MVKLTSMNVSQSINMSVCPKLIQLPLSKLEPQLVTPLVCIFLTLTVSATLLNSMTFILYFKKSQLRKKRSVKLLLSLAASDLMVGVLVSPISIAQTLKQLSSPCHYINRIARGCQIIMILTVVIMCTITLEQYLNIVRHNIYHKVLPSCRFKLFLSAPWIFSISLLVFGSFSNLAGLWTVVFTWFIMFVTIFVIYWKIHIHLQNRQKSWNSQEHSNVLITIHKQNKKSTKMMLRIVTGVIICSITGYCSMVVILLDHYQVAGLPWLKTWRKYPVAIIANILQQSNSIVNPVLYYCRSTDFSKALKELVTELKNSTACYPFRKTPRSDQDTPS